MHSFKSRKWLSGRLLGAGLLAVSTWAGAAQVSYGQQSPVQPAGGLQPNAPTVSGQQNVTSAEKADFTIELGDTFRLRHEQAGLITEVLASRPGIVKLDTDPKDPTILIVQGVNVGVTQVTINAKTRDNQTLQPTIRTIQINPDVKYIRSKVAETFPTANLKIVSGGTAGSLIVTGTVESAEDVEPIRNFLNGIVAQYRSTGGGAALDMVSFAVRVSGPQVVQLDVCLALVNRQEIRRLGVDFFHRDGRSFLSTTIAGASGGAAEGFGGLATNGSANFTFGVREGNSTFLGFIDALRTESVGKVLANPTLICLSGRPSRFTVGGEVPYGTAGVGAAGGSGGSGVQFRQFGTVVGFLPTVIGDGRIRLTVAAENTTVVELIQQANIIAPRLSGQAVGSTLELENGQSMALCGLIENRVTGRTTRYPILGDLPFVGSLFRTVSFDEQELELVILVKVSLVEGMDSAQRCNIKLPGQETRSPNDFELFLEGILEAPRGPRNPFIDRHYVPAFKLDAPFGAKSGECNLPGPLCEGKFKHGRNDCGNCATSQCGTGVMQHAQMMQQGVPTVTLPATGVQQTQQMVVPEPVSIPMPNSATETKPAGDASGVPVVPVPVVPAAETPVPVKEEAKPASDLPVPPAPPAPGEPK